MSTKIVVCVRTRDEEQRIAKFCEAYADADMILVADGGSEDNTKEIAKTFPNAIIRDFTERTQLQNGYWRNNDSRHANFLFAWAKEYNPDWIIYEDCDCLPNYLLKAKFRSILEHLKHDYVLLVKFYLWGTKKHFPHLCKPAPPHVKFEPSLWAFRGNQDFWTVDVPPAYDFRIGKTHVRDLHLDADAFDLLPPYACMHFAWDDPVRTAKKMTIYRESGLIPGQLHPLEFGGPLENLPPYLHL